MFSCIIMTVPGEVFFLHKIFIEIYHRGNQLPNADIGYRSGE